MKRSTNHQRRFLIILFVVVCLLIGYSVEQTLRFYRNNSNHVSKQQSQHHDKSTGSSEPGTNANHNQKPEQSIIEEDDKNQLPNDQTTLSSSMLKSFIRMNSVRAYHLDLHTYRDEIKHGGDASFVNSSSDSDRQQCARHLAKYFELLSAFHNKDPISELTSLSALQLADTFGRPEAGILNGNQYWLGNYELCQSYIYKSANETAEQQVESIKSQYCLGVVQFPNWTPSEGKTSLKIGLCLPETCTSSMLSDNEDLLAQVQTMMMFQIHPNGPFSKLQLRHVYCLPHETSQLRQLTFSAKALIALLSGLVMFSIFATILDYDNKQKDNTKQLQLQHETDWRRVVIEAFSISRNMNKFFSVRSKPVEPSGEKSNGYTQSSPAKTVNNDNHKQILVIPGVDYTPFNEIAFFETMSGIKCLGLFWIIAGHTFLVSPILSSGLADLDRLTKTYLADIYLAAHLMVDTFFVLMGMIASFMIFKGGIEKFTNKHWIAMTIHRYWRLTPIYLICYWFTKSLGSLVNSGPMWDFATSETSPRVNCARESWLTAILHLSDFKSPKDHCVPFAWFIANGIKFCIITPIFLLPIAKSMKRGYSIALTTLLANTILVYWLASKTNVDVQAVIEFKPESADNMLNNMGQIYTRPYSRIGAYLIGLLAGHLFYLEKTGLLRIKLSRDRARIGWIIFSLATIGLIFLLKIVRHLSLNEKMMQDSFSAGSAIIRPIWSLCTCWLVFALSHGQVSWLINFLSAKFWLICVKLSFCAYLSQGEVIANLYLASPILNTGTQYLDLISRPIFVVILTILVSFLMVIFIELPLNGIEKLIFPSTKGTSKTSKHKTTNSLQQIREEHKVK